MPRPVKVDRSVVLHHAAEVFLALGYEKASITNICDATGLLRGSLYASYKNKRGIFLAALDSYFADFESKFFSIFIVDMPPLVKIRYFFKAVIRYAAQDCECLLVNAILENDSSDQELQQRIHQMFAKLEAHFKSTLEQAIFTKDLEQNYDCHAGAKYLLLNFYGIWIMQKNSPNHPELNSMTDKIMAAIH